MLNIISRPFNRSQVALWRSPSGVNRLLPPLRGDPRFPGIANSFKRSIATKPEQHRKLEAHFEARKEYVNALGNRFVPDLPAREVQGLSRRTAGLLHPAVRKLPNFPCPNLATLKLDQALKDGQWLLIRQAAPKYNQVRVTLRTLLQREGVTTSSLFIPNSVLEGADAIWLCPHFDAETLTLRLRRASGDDSAVIFPLKQLVMSECGRSLAKLAYSEGLIPSATYTSALSRVQKSHMVDEAGSQVQKDKKRDFSEMLWIWGALVWDCACAIWSSLSPLSSLVSHTRFLCTLRSRSRAYDYHSIVVFRLSSTTGEESRDIDSDSNSTPLSIDSMQIYAMESTCPHLGADMGHADIEDTDVGLVAVCPWHRYDFDLRTGHSETGLRACTFEIQMRNDEGNTSDPVIWVEAPGEGDWEVVELRPVSEEFADPPNLSQLSLEDRSSAKPQEELDQPAPTTLLEWAVLILNTPQPQLKVDRTRQAVAAFRTGKLKSVGRNKPLARPPPDMPPRDQLNVVQPGKVAKRGKAGSVKSRIAILHALANIEQWAIDLAWDMIARFGKEKVNGEPLPHQFFLDWTKVAEDESKHFSLLRKRLEELGSFYGSHTVHAGLWESAQQTSQSLSSRLCIIHLVHEARGLDVNPATIAKFRNAGDLDSVKVLEIIHHDEITHVTAGHRWFSYLCEKTEQHPVATFRQEVRNHFSGALKGPFNEEDRRKAGMTPDFYEDLRGELGQPTQMNDQTD